MDPPAPPDSDACADESKQVTLPAIGPSTPAPLSAGQAPNATTAANASAPPAQPRPDQRRRPPHRYADLPKALPDAEGIERWTIALDIFDKELTGTQQGYALLEALRERRNCRKDGEAYWLHFIANHYWGMGAMVIVRRQHRGGNRAFNITFTKLLREMDRNAELLIEWLGEDAVASWLADDDPDEKAAIQAEDRAGWVALIRRKIQSNLQSLDVRCTPISDYADTIAHLIPVDGGVGKMPQRRILNALDELRDLCRRYGKLVGLNVPAYTEEISRIEAELEREFENLLPGLRPTPGFPGEDDEND